MEREQNQAQLNEHLRVASQRGLCATVRGLLKSGAQVNAQGADGWVALVEAAYWGHLQVVQQLLRAGAQVDSIGSYGWTALMSAAYFGHEKIVRELLKKGAELDMQAHAVGRDRWSALMLAACSGHTSVVKQLLEAGADPELKDRNGRTALDMAEEGGHTHVVELLALEKPGG